MGTNVFWQKKFVRVPKKIFQNFWNFFLRFLQKFWFWTLSWGVTPPAILCQKCNLKNLGARGSPLPLKGHQRQKSSKVNRVVYSSRFWRCSRKRFCVYVASRAALVVPTALLVVPTVPTVPTVPNDHIFTLTSSRKTNFVTKIMCVDKRCMTKLASLGVKISFCRGITS